MVKKSHYCSSPLLHKVDLATLRGFGLYPSNKTLFAISPVVLGEDVAVCLTTTTVAAIAILLVSIPCARILGMVLAWKELRERDPMPLFKACGATFVVAMASLKKMLFGLGSLDFGERDER